MRKGTIIIGKTSNAQDNTFLPDLEWKKKKKTAEFPFPLHPTHSNNSHSLSVMLLVLSYPTKINCNIIITLLLFLSNFLEQRGGVEGVHIRKIPTGNNPVSLVQREHWVPLPASLSCFIWEKKLDCELSSATE